MRCRRLCFLTLGVAVSAILAGCTASLMRTLSDESRPARIDYAIVDKGRIVSGEAGEWSFRSESVGTGPFELLHGAHGRFAIGGEELLVHVTPMGPGTMTWRGVEISGHGPLTPGQRAALLSIGEMAGDETWRELSRIPLTVGCRSLGLRPGPMAALALPMQMYLKHISTQPLLDTVEAARALYRERRTCRYLAYDGFSAREPGNPGQMGKTVSGWLLLPRDFPIPRVLGFPAIDGIGWRVDRGAGPNTPSEGSHGTYRGEDGGPVYGLRQVQPVEPGWVWSTTTRSTMTTTGEAASVPAYTQVPWADIAQGAPQNALGALAAQAGLEALDRAMTVRPGILDCMGGIEYPQAYGPASPYTGGRSLCRGACGGDCAEPNCTTEVVRLGCIAPGFAAVAEEKSCKTHEACRWHDKCYDCCVSAYGRSPLFGWSDVGRQGASGVGESLDCHGRCDYAAVRAYGMDTFDYVLGGKPGQMAEIFAGTYDSEPMTFTYASRVERDPACDEPGICPDEPMTPVSSTMLMTRAPSPNSIPDVAESDASGWTLEESGLAELCDDDPDNDPVMTPTCQKDCLDEAPYRNPNIQCACPPDCIFKTDPMNNRAVCACDTMTRRVEPACCPKSHQGYTCD